MTGTQEVTKDSQEETEYVQGSSLSDSEKDRLIQNAKDNTSKCQVTNSEVVGVRCTKSKRDRYTLDIHHAGGTSTVDIRDALPAEKAEDFMNSYEMGKKAYITVFDMEYAGEERVFIADISEDYEEAMDTKKEIDSYRDDFDQLKFKFKDDTRKIRFGEEHRYRYYLPGELDSDFIEVDRENTSAVALYALIYVLGSVFFFSELPILILMGLLTYLSGIIVAYLGYKISDNTFTVSTIDMNPEVLKRGFDEDVEVRKLDIVTTDDYVKLNDNKEGVTWTIEKGEFGDLDERGKELLSAGKKSGDKMFIPVSRPDSVRRGIESDGGQYVVPIFED